MQAAPNSTLDQTLRYTDKFRDILTAIPEKAHVFQITNPSGDAAGFSGMVGKTWSERTRTMEQIMPQLTKDVSEDPGHRRHRNHAPAVAGRQQLRHRVYHRFHG